MGGGGWNEDLFSFYSLYFGITKFVYHLVTRNNNINKQNKNGQTFYFIIFDNSLFSSLFNLVMMMLVLLK